MREPLGFLLLVLLAALPLAACSGGDEPAGDPARSGAAGRAGGVAASAGGKSLSGEVVETMNAAGYTYVRVRSGEKTVWAATREFPVEVGDRVSFLATMPMVDFPSSALGRTFDLIYFCDRISVGGKGGPVPPRAGIGAGGGSAGGAPATAGMHGGLAAKPPAEVDLSGIERAAGGKTVAEIFGAARALQGKLVQVRGRVVKYTPDVMGKNWLHLRDGTGAAGANDLTVTTPATVKVGDLVLVRGRVATGRDFGFGYRYDVMIEDAVVTVETAR